MMTKRVFVVDDEELIADTVAAILHNFGYEAKAFYSARAALAACDNLSPELVVSDVAMPGMSGVEMAILIRERHPACKILLFSGQAETFNLLEEARKRGYDFELLMKPVHPKDLLAKLDRLSRDQLRPVLDSSAQRLKTA
jgi:DNA-binding NtrC family response regulator